MCLISLILTFNLQVPKLTQNPFQKQFVICEVSGFCNGIVESFTLLGCYVVYAGCLITDILGQTICLL